MRKASDTGPLSEAGIRALADDRIFARGDGYCARGNVLELARRGEVLHALVAGHRDDPYHVQVLVRGDRILARCDCPYAGEWGECCKHMVAALLAFVRGTVECVEQPTVSALLSPLPRAALEALIERMVDLDPWLYDEVRAPEPRPHEQGSDLR